MYRTGKRFRGKAFPARHNEKTYVLTARHSSMPGDVMPFDDRQWGKLQADMRRPLTQAEKVKLARIREGVREISRMVDF